MRFGLVSFPVHAFNARMPEAGELHFHLLHAPCHSRIRYEKHCPLHGAVSNDEIVSGYEYSRGRYVEIEPEELDKLRTQSEKALSIDNFIEPDELDPIYFDGRMYFLAPDGAAAREPYAVFLKALERQGRVGIGQVVFSGKEQVVLVRPYHGALSMAMLNYEPEIRDPAEVVAELLPVRGADKKIHLAEQLIDQWTNEDFDFSTYVDTYGEKVKRLVESKVEGRELVTPEEEPAPEVINLMDALRRSVSQAKGRKAAGHATRRAARRHRRRAS